MSTRILPDRLTINRDPSMGLAAEADESCWLVADIRL